MATKPNKFQAILLKDLAALGNGTTLIAATLEKKGYKGVSESDNNCPIANYLKDEYPGEDVEVTDETVTVNGVTVSTPKPITKFVQKFDANDYPDLIQPRDEAP